MKTLSALFARLWGEPSEGNPLATGRFPRKGSVMLTFDVCINIQARTSCWTHSWVAGELTPSDVIVMFPDFLASPGYQQQWCWHHFRFNSLWPNDAIWRHRSGSTLVQVMACCLTASSHYLSQCWLIISKIGLHPSDDNFTRDTSVIND